MNLYSPSYSYPFNRRKTDFRPRIRSDSAIEEEIWDRLSEENAAWFSPDHLGIEVEHGQVHLSGHAAEGWQRQRIQTLAARVRGVTRVRNEILLDGDVRARVVRSLAEDERTAPYLIPVKCSFGWIYLGGVVPTQEAARAAGEVAGSLPEGRGVLSLPWVVGLPWTDPASLEPVRRAFQPRPGAVVYDGQTGQGPAGAGWVSQIVLDPCSRLLSHLVVPPRDPEPGRQPASICRERVVPVGAIEAANRDCVWLKAGKELDRYPLFHPEQVPPAPQDWRPPFPYKTGTVRWSWGEIK